MSKSTKWANTYRRIQVFLSFWVCIRVVIKGTGKTSKEDSKETHVIERLTVENPAPYVEVDNDF